MHTGPVTAELMQVEALFQERRRRVLRAEALVAAALALGLLVVLAAKGSAPQHVTAAIAVLVALLSSAMLNVWRIARRHWRCPACDVRWQTVETLASLEWNHCSSCGAALRAHPRERELERSARLAFEREALPRDALLERLARRRRRALWSAAGILLAGLGFLAWLESRGVGNQVLQVALAGVSVAVAVTAVSGARCPRCMVGMLAPGRHCMRCGLHFEPPADAERGARRPTG